MLNEFQGLSKHEVNAMIKDQLDKNEALRREMGCQSKHGCLAGKAHFKEHELKWSSDIYNLKAFQEEQESENKVVIRKMSEASTMLHDVVKDLSHVLNNHKRLDNDLTLFKKDHKEEQELKWQEQNKRINKHENRFWWMVGIVVAASLMAIWRVNTSVSNGDLINQNRTETFFALTLSELSGKPVNEILERHRQHFHEHNKTKTNKKGVK